MQIEIEALPAAAVKIDGLEYLRLGERNWWILIGCSYEQVSDETELEKAYREQTRREGGYG